MRSECSELPYRTKLLGYRVQLQIDVCTYISPQGRNELERIIVVSPTPMQQLSARVVGSSNSSSGTSIVNNLALVLRAVVVGSSSMPALSLPDFQQHHTWYTHKSDRR